MNHYQPERNGKKICPECGFPIKCNPEGSRVWKGVNICYDCFKQHIRNNTATLSVERRTYRYNQRVRNRDK